MRTQILCDSIPNIEYGEEKKEKKFIKHRSQLSGYVFCGECGRKMMEKPIHSGTKHEQRIWYCFDESHLKVKIKQNDVLSCLLENLNKELIKIIPKAKKMLADYNSEGVKDETERNIERKVLARMEKLSYMLLLEQLPLGLCTALIEKITLKKKAVSDNTDTTDSDINNNC